MSNGASRVQRLVRLYPLGIQVSGNGSHQNHELADPATPNVLYLDISCSHSGPPITCRAAGDPITQGEQMAFPAAPGRISRNLPMIVGEPHTGWKIPKTRLLWASTHASSRFSRGATKMDCSRLPWYAPCEDLLRRCPDIRRAAIRACFTLQCVPRAQCSFVGLLGA